MGVSHKMLTRTLRGLVRRTVHPEVPVRVVYALTDDGRTLLEPPRALQQWSIKHLSGVSVEALTREQFGRR